jgi:hypothetical protein
VVVRPGEPRDTHALRIMHAPARCFVTDQIYVAKCLQRLRGQPRLLCGRLRHAQVSHKWQSEGTRQGQLNPGFQGRPRARTLTQRTDEASPICLIPNTNKSPGLIFGVPGAPAGPKRSPTGGPLRGFPSRAPAGPKHSPAGGPLRGLPVGLLTWCLGISNSDLCFSSAPLTFGHEAGSANLTRRVTGL